MVTALHFAFKNVVALKIKIYQKNVPYVSRRTLYLMPYVSQKSVKSMGLQKSGSRYAQLKWHAHSTNSALFMLGDFEDGLTATDFQRHQHVFDTILRAAVQKVSFRIIFRVHFVRKSALQRNMYRSSLRISEFFCLTIFLVW